MKDRTTAGILAFFGGSLGIHRFYLGQTFLGVLSIIFCFTTIPFFIGIINGITLFSMSDQEFDRKYNPDYFYQNQQQGYYNQQSYQQQRQQYKSQRNQRRAPQRRNYPMASDRQQQPRAQNAPLNQRRSRPVVDNRFKQEGTRLYKDYDFKGAIENYQKSLRIQPTDPQIHFNLACLYSLMEDAQHAYIHLEKAVEQGYPHFEKIKTHDHLAYLRTHPQYDDFVKNGYHVAPQKTMQLGAANEGVMDLTTNVIEKLKQLAELRDKGILTEEEFQLQKEKVLRK